MSHGTPHRNLKSILAVELGPAIILGVPKLMANDRAVAKVDGAITLQVAYQGTCFPA